jgi:hypothetical protein
MYAHRASNIQDIDFGDAILASAFNLVYKELAVFKAPYLFF